MEKAYGLLTRIATTPWLSVAVAFAPTGKRQIELHAMRDMVKEGDDILRHGRDLRDFGKIVHEGWKLKRTLSSRIIFYQPDARGKGPLIA